MSLGWYHFLASNVMINPGENCQAKRDLKVKSVKCYFTLNILGACAFEDKICPRCVVIPNDAIEIAEKAVILLISQWLA